MQEPSADRRSGNIDSRPTRNLPSTMTSKGTGGNCEKRNKSDNDTSEEATKEIKESDVATSSDGSQNNVIDFSKLLVYTMIYIRLSFTKQLLSTLLVLNFI
jgi:hypothetical protein